MGIIKERLKHMGYNVKERAYIYGGFIVGAIAPIVGAKYLLFNGTESANWAEEAIKWGGVLLVNASTMIFPPHMPAPVYTGLAGVTIGTVAAQGSQRKRYEKEKTLEKITKETSE